MALTTVTLYSDINGDGYNRKYDSTSWATTHSASTATDNGNTTTTAKIGVSKYNDGSNILIQLHRGFFPFDTSSLPDKCRIISAVFSVYITEVGDVDNDGNDFINIVQTTQASPTAIATSDYSKCGTESNPTEGSTRVDLTGFSISQYMDFQLNASGLSWINKTGYTMIGLRSGHDITNNAPSTNPSSGATTLNARIACYTTDNGSNKPKLVITYGPRGAGTLLGVG